MVIMAMQKALCTLISTCFHDDSVQKNGGKQLVFEALDPIAGDWPYLRLGFVLADRLGCGDRDCCTDRRSLDLTGRSFVPASRSSAGAAGQRQSAPAWISCAVPFGRKGGDLLHLPASCVASGIDDWSAGAGAPCFCPGTDPDFIHWADLCPVPAGFLVEKTLYRRAVSLGGYSFGSWAGASDRRDRCMGDRPLCGRAAEFLERIYGGHA